MIIVFFSGGAGSAASVIKMLQSGYNKKEMLLLFADTKIEDPDLYRFINEFSFKTEIELKIIADGRTPQQVFKDKKWLGNSRIAQCSHVLKQNICKSWVQKNCNENDLLVVGIDWSEIHRLKKITEAWKPFHVTAPLCEPPYLDKNQCFKLIRDMGIKVPSLYLKGFSHNNCGGACVKAGKGQWRKLLLEFPERFHQWEMHEKEMQVLLQRPVTILKDETLEQLRIKVEKEAEHGIQIDLFDLGGCGCFSEQ